MATDAELGFSRPARRLPSAPADDRARTRTGVLDDATTAVEIDMLNRRDALRVTAIGGAALLAPLAQWLEPLADGPLSGSGAFAVAEVEAVQHLVATFRSSQEWEQRGAPDGPLTDRVFLAAAELASVAGWMATTSGGQIELRDHALARIRAMNSVSLGRVHLLAREPELSAVTVRSALPLIDPHRPGWLGRKLAEWHREAAPFAAVAEVQDTREQTRELVGV